MDPVRNLLSVTVSAGYDFAATTIGLNSGHGALLPNPATEGAFNLLWWNQSSYPNPENDSNVELVRINNVIVDTLEISRAQESTSASNKNTAGATYKLALVYSKKTSDDFQNLIATKLSITGGNATLTSLTAAYTKFNSLTSNSISSFCITSISGNIQSLSSAVIIFSDNSKLITAPSVAGANISAATENYILKYSSNSALTNSMIVDNNIFISTISASISSLTANRIIFSDGTHITTGYPEIPNAPILNFPINSATQTDRNLLFSWSAADRAISYTLQVATDVNFAGLFYNQNNLSVTAQQVNSMVNATTYYWRVSGSNSGGTGSYSTTSSFTTYILLPPVLNSPTAGQIGVAIDPTFSWASALSASTYALQLSVSGDFSTTASSSAGISITSLQISGLTNNKIYYWHVNSQNQGGTSDYSTSSDFTTINLPPPTTSYTGSCNFWYENWSTRGWGPFSGTLYPLGDLKWTRKESVGGSAGITSWPYSTSSLSAAAIKCQDNNTSWEQLRLLSMSAANIIAASSISAFWMQALIARPTGAIGSYNYRFGIISPEEQYALVNGIFFDICPTATVSACTRKASAQTTVNTAFSSSAGFNKYTISAYQYGAEFFIDDVWKTSISSNIPIVTTMIPFFGTIGRNVGGNTDSYIIEGRYFYKQPGPGTVYDGANPP